MADVTVSYKGSTIAEMSASGGKTLLTAGKYCEADISLAYVKPSGNPTAEENDVIFIDYDGTIRYSYSADDFLALTELPPNPVHSGLTAQGWNWTLSDAKSNVEAHRRLTIGQSYVTDDDATRIYLDFPTWSMLTITIYWWQDTNLMRIDWGDGVAENIDGSGIVSATHTYSAPGKKLLRMIRRYDGIFKLGNNQNSDGLFGPDSNTRKMQRDLVRAIEFGQGHYVWQVSALRNLTNLEYVTLAKRETGSVYGANNLFLECRSLKALVYPQNIYAGNTGSIEYCSALERVSMRAVDSNTFGHYLCYSAYALKRIDIPNGITTINNYAFSDGYCLSALSLPASLTNIGTAAFNSAALAEVRFASTTPPTIANSNAFGGLTAASIIYVPYASLAAYLAATNYPSKSTQTYIGFATYQSGATLPTQDGTAAYNVVWYASKADAIAQTSAITTGNGKEIYCRYTAV